MALRCGAEPYAPRAPGLGWGWGSCPGASLGHGEVGLGSGLMVPQVSRADPDAVLGGCVQVLLSDVTVSLPWSHGPERSWEHVSPPQTKS